MAQQLTPLLRDELDANNGLVTMVYSDRETRPRWFHKADEQHDAALRNIRVHCAKCTWMVKKLYEDFGDARFRACFLACFLVALL
jgi:hypothetical protein